MPAAAVQKEGVGRVTDGWVWLTSEAGERTSDVLELVSSCFGADIDVESAVVGSSFTSSISFFFSAILPLLYRKETFLFALLPKSSSWMVPTSWK